MADSGKIYTNGTDMAITVGGAETDEGTGVGTGAGAGRGDSRCDSSGAWAEVWQYLTMVWRTSITQPDSMRDFHRLGGTPASVRVKWSCGTGVGTFFQRREASRTLKTAH